MLGLLALLVTTALLYVWGVEALPTRLMFALNAVAVLYAAFEVFHEVRVERDEHAERNEEFIRSRPNLEIVGQKFVGLYVNGQSLFHVLQLWFCNEPDYRNVHSIARNVTIRLTFFTDNSATPLFTYASQWVEAVDPEVASFNNRSPFIDIPANDNPAKCIVLLQHRPDDPNCYAHSFGKLIGTPDGRYPPYIVRPGRYRVNACVRGDNLEQEFDLVLVNHGTASAPEFIGVPNRSDVAVPSQAFDE